MICENLPFPHGERSNPVNALYGMFLVTTPGHAESW